MSADEVMDLDPLPQDADFVADDEYLLSLLKKLEWDTDDDEAEG